MKKIGIDARLYFQTGVGVYLRNLLYYLQKSNANFIFFVYVLKDDSSKINFKNKNFIKREVTSRWHTLSEQISFLRDIKKDDLDLIHFTYFGYPAFYKRKFIATIHDLTPVVFKTGKASTRNQLIFNLKHLVFEKIILSSQIKNSFTIITPTNSVKKQIVGHYGDKYQRKITPIYEGVNYELLKAQENSQLEKKFNNFFLYVGNFYPHKNCENLIQAFSHIKENVNLVLVGPNDFFAAKVKDLVKKLNQEKRIFFHHNPKIEDFVFFYKGARALVHPSLSEGFGLPLVESIYFNLPIIASNIEVFQEILGDKYLKFDPNNIENIKNKIENFLNNRPKIIYENSFERMTKETLEIYKKSL